MSNQQLKTHQLRMPQTGMLAEKARENILRMVQREEEHISELVPDKFPERRTYPESEFRRHFLPIISGQALANLPEDYTEERLNNEVHDCWLRISQGPGYEVDVVEPGGRVAFTVPAMMDTSLLNTAQSQDEVGLRHANHLYAQTNSPSAERELEISLSRKLTTLFRSNADQAETARKIEAMRQYYGLSTPESIKEPTQEPQQTNNDYMGEMSFD